jgi:hypothetical protein
LDKLSRFWVRKLSFFARPTRKTVQFRKRHALQTTNEHNPTTPEYCSPDEKKDKLHKVMSVCGRDRDRFRDLKKLSGFLLLFSCVFFSSLRVMLPFSVW